MNKSNIKKVEGKQKTHLNDVKAQTEGKQRNPSTDVKMKENKKTRLMTLISRSNYHLVYLIGKTELYDCTHWHEGKRIPVHYHVKF